MSKIIKITSGTGEGSTNLASFDAALFDAGIANYNLIKLSSIIPDGFKPIKEKTNLNSTDFGHRLYVVMSSQTEHKLDSEAWAGIGWVMSETEPRHGLFVEHEGPSEEQVVGQIKSTLADMTAYRPEKFGPIEYEVVGKKCLGKPVSAVVAAIYQSEPWQ